MFFRKILFLLFLVPHAAFAFQWDEIPPHAWGDTKGFFATPSIMTAFATTALALSTYEYADTDWTVSQKDEYLGSANSWIANGGLALALASPAITWWDGERGKRASEEIVESLTLTAITTYSLKYGVGRTRPNGGSGSFPSGHTSFTFAPATVIAYEYPWYIGIPSLLIAAGVGFARVDSLDHFASDVIAGAGIGAFFATATYSFHKSNPPLIFSHLTPEVAPHHFGFHWTQEF